jgi:hypothetical protein
MRGTRRAAVLVSTAICLSGCGGSHSGTTSHAASATPSSAPPSPAAQPGPSASTAATPGETPEAYAAELTAYLKTREQESERLKSTRLVPSGRAGVYNVVMTTDLPAHTVTEYRAATGRPSGQIREEFVPRIGLGAHCEQWVHQHPALQVDLCEVLDAPRSGLGAGVPIDLDPPGPPKTFSPEEDALNKKVAKTYRQFYDTLGTAFDAQVKATSKNLRPALTTWYLVDDDKWILTFYLELPPRDAGEPADVVRTSPDGQAFAETMQRWADEHPDAGIIATRVLDNDFRLVGATWKP